MSIELVLIPVAIALVGAVGSWKREQQNTENSFCLETRFSDEQILRSALEQYGCAPADEDGALSAAVGRSLVRFQSTSALGLDAVFRGNISLEEARAFVLEIDAEYGRLVQQAVHQRLMSEARHRGFVLETEEVMEDNSVLLRFAVG